MLFKLAFRNIWRNKRQSFLTIGAVAFAVFLACFLRSFQKGAWDNVVDSSVNMYYGYLQVHKKGYWNDQTIDQSFETNAELNTELLNISEIKNVVPRLESFALASTGTTTSGVLTLGINPEKEASLTKLSDKIISGKYLILNDDGILIAQGLSEKLKLAVNDTLVLISQGYHGVNAAGKYPIRGIVKFPLPDLNKSLVFMTLPVAQEFLGASNRVTSLALQIPEERLVAKTKQQINSKISTDMYEVLDYKELMPDLLQARRLDEMGAYLIIFVLYCLIAFTLFGTILMMTKKRSYEFGVLLSIGMQRFELFFTICIEIFLQSVLGILIGIAAVLPISFYFHNYPVNMDLVAKDAASAFEKFGVEPVFGFSVTPDIFINQSTVIFIITLLISIYPLLNLFKLKPIVAMRN